MEINNWNVIYTTIKFFENALRSHEKVESFTREDDIRFMIRRRDFVKINTILVDCYTMGIADVHSVVAEFGKVNCIVTSANWNYYTMEAKEFGFQNNIAIFNVSEFFGALWWDNYIQYHKKDDKGRKIYAIR